MHSLPSQQSVSTPQLSFNPAQELSGDLVGLADGGEVTPVFLVGDKVGLLEGVAVGDVVELFEEATLSDTEGQVVAAPSFSFV